MPHKHWVALLFFLGLLPSCALQSTSTRLTQYQQAVLYYETRNYYKASQLLEEVLPLLRGKKEEASACFYRAYCSFHQRKYAQSADQFKFFRKTFLRDSRIEEAMYMQGHALYSIAPDVKLDQTCTQEAVRVLHNYLNSYPEGAYVDTARVQLRNMNDKLALKAFKNAKLYHGLNYHRAAVVTLAIFQQDFPDSCYDEEAAYLKADAQYAYFKKTKKTHNNIEHRRIIAPGSHLPHIIAPGSHLPHAPQSTDIERADPLNQTEAELQCFKDMQEVDVQEIDVQEQHRIAIRYCQEFLDKYPDSRYALAVRALSANLCPFAKPEENLKRP